MTIGTRPFLAGLDSRTAVDAGFQTVAVDVVGHAFHIRKFSIWQYVSQLVADGADGVGGDVIVGRMFLYGPFLTLIIHLLVDAHPAVVNTDILKSNIRQAALDHHIGCLAHDRIADIDHLATP